MATKWHNEPWRKLYTKRDAKWLSLPLSARGLADELIKYADDNGRLFELEPDIPVGRQVAITCSAKPGEYKRVADDTARLLTDGYLVVDENWLCIRNFGDAQERMTPQAVRSKRHRDKKRSEQRSEQRDEENGDDMPPTRGSETRRDEKKKENTHAGAREKGMWGAWIAAGLPPMQDPMAMAELHVILANGGAKESDLFELCADFKKLTDGWRKTGRAAGSGASPALMIKHLDKVQLVRSGELDPAAPSTRASAPVQQDPPRPRLPTAAEVIAKRNEAAK